MSSRDRISEDMYSTKECEICNTKFSYVGMLCYPCFKTILDELRCKLNYTDYCEIVEAYHTFRDKHMYELGEKFLMSEVDRLRK